MLVRLLKQRAERSTKRKWDKMLLNSDIPKNIQGNVAWARESSSSIGSVEKLRCDLSNDDQTVWLRHATEIDISKDILVLEKENHRQTSHAKEEFIWVGYYNDWEFLTEPVAVATGTTAAGAPLFELLLLRPKTLGAPNPCAADELLTTL